MSLKSILLAVGFLILVLVPSYYVLDIRSSKSYFNDEIDVTYDHPFIGADTVYMTFHKPGKYVVTFVPGLDAKNAEKTPLPIVVMVDSTPTYRVIRQSSLPQPLMITIISSSPAVSMHQFP